MNELKSTAPLYVNFGGTIFERLAVFKRIAEELHAAGKTRSRYLWRLHLVRTVMERCNQPREVVYPTMEQFGQENVSILRKAYFGGRDPYEGTAKKRKETIARKKAGSGTSASTRVGKGVEDDAPSVPPTALLDRVDEMYASALNELSFANRTREKLADKLTLNLATVDSYLFQHPEFAENLTDGRVARDISYLGVEK